jgi:hypothetical protein
MARFVPLPAFSSTLVMPLQCRNSTVQCLFLAHFNPRMLPFPMPRPIPTLPTPPSVYPRHFFPTNLLCGSVPPWRSSLSSLCFHTLTNCLSCLPAGLLTGKPFVLTTIRIAPACPLQRPYFNLSASVRSVSLWQIRSFHTIADSLSSRKKSSALESRTSGLFCKNTRGGGATNLVPDHVLHGVPNSRDSQRAALFAESPAFAAAFRFQNHYLPEAALC